MVNIDKMINNILGKKPKTVRKPTTRKVIKGASVRMQNRWKSFSPTTKRVLRKRLPDRDKDKVPNRYDCQPCNRFRQDSKTSYSPNVVEFFVSHNGFKIYDKTKDPKISDREYFEKHYGDVTDHSVVNGVNMFFTDGNDGGIGFGTNKTKIRDGLLKNYIKLIDSQNNKIYLKRTINDLYEAKIITKTELKDYLNYGLNL